MDSRLPIVLLVSTVLVTMAIAQTDLPLRSVAGHTTRRPRFDLPLRYRIVEELPVGTTIADLVVDAGLKRKYGPEVLNELEYRLLQDPAPVAITVGLRTGLLTTVGRVDRDELATCRDKATCELTIDVTVRPARYFQVIKVTIEVLDINDNEPRFRDQQIVPGLTSSPAAVIVRIRESASPGTSFALPVAVDSDGPESGVRTYELMELISPTLPQEADSGVFVLDIVTRPHDQLEPRLVVRRPLDRERRSDHRFRLIAYDGGRPPKSGSVEIEVQVLDSNDNAPVFDVPGTGYEANVTENVAVGTSIIQVHATDDDEGTNAEVVYRFSGHTLSTYGNLFSIDNRTGKISVVGPLDRERYSIYQLTVIAQDLGPDSMPVDAAVVVRVIDINDNAPVIAVNTLQRNAAPPGDGTSKQMSLPGDGSAVVAVNAEVPENLAAGAFVGHMSVSDDDSGDSGRVECNITETAAFSLVRRGRSSTEYQILTAESFDRELRDRYDPVITCWDAGLPPLTSSVYLTVRILDGNDNRPQFGQPSYSTRVAENSPPGTVILRLSAADLDIGINADIHYALATSSSADSKATGHGTVGLREGPFLIDPDDGTITVSGSGLQSSIDREQYSSFSFAVLAIDHGTSVSQTGSTVVVVAIDDVNDEFPVFSMNRYVFDVDENRPEMEVVGTIVASDGDATRPNNIVFYRMQFDVSDDTRRIASEKSFSMDPDTGIIRTTMPLDREQYDTYHFTVVAADRGRPSLSATAQVVIRVLDVNDNDPVFGLGDDRRRFDENSVIVVSGLAPTGSYVTSVTAFDVDDAENGRLRYQIVAQRLRRQLSALDELSSQLASPDEIDYNERFAIDPDSGDIVIAGLFPELKIGDGVDEIEILDFLLTVRATDCGFPARWTEIEVHVLVNASVPYLRAPNENGAFPSARWKPEATQDHVTIVAWVGASSALATVVLLVLIAVVRMRSRRKSRLDRRRQSSVEDFRDRLTEARLALTTSSSHPAGSVTIRKDSLHQPVTVECCDEQHGSTAETMPLQHHSVRFDTGSRCCSPCSQQSKAATMTTWSESRHGNVFVTGNGSCDLLTSCGRDAVIIDRQKCLSTPMVQAVVMACAAAASENERDSQHSGGEASNADSGRGHSSCCGDDSTDESVIACRLLHHHWQHGSGAANGATGTCCVAGPTSRMIHYLPPPPPPRMASCCPSAAAAAAANQHRGVGWSTLSGGSGFKSNLTAHTEGIECHVTGAENQLRQPSTTMTSSTLSRVPQSSVWTASTAQRQTANSRPAAQLTVTSDLSMRNVIDNSSLPGARSVPTSPQHTGNGSSVVWHSNKNGVVV